MGADDPRHHAVSGLTSMTLQTTSRRQSSSATLTSRITRTSTRSTRARSPTRGFNRRGRRRRGSRGSRLSPGPRAGAGAWHHRYRADRVLLFRIDHCRASRGPVVRQHLTAAFAAFCLPSSDCAASAGHMARRIASDIRTARTPPPERGVTPAEKGRVPCRHQLRRFAS